MATNIPKLRQKVGDTFTAGALHTDSASAPVNLSGYTIDSQLRNGITNALIATFTVTILPQTGATLGRFQLLKEYTGVVDSTDTWPIGNHKIDVQFTSGATRYSTPTFFIEVEPGVTV